MSVNIIYNDINPASIPRGTLFAGKVYWLSHHVPQRTRWIEGIKANGGSVHMSEDRADVKVVDTIKPSAIEDAVTWKFIEKSLETGVLENEDDHRPPRAGTSKSGATRTSGGFAPTKSTRTPFTAADDQALIEHVKRNAQPAGSSSSELGRKLYQDLAEINNRHTAQSWQDRWKNRFHGNVTCDYQRRAAEENATLQALEKREVTFNRPAAKTNIASAKPAPTKITSAEPTEPAQTVWPTPPDPNSFYVGPSFRQPPAIPEIPSASRFFGIDQLPLVGTAHHTAGTESSTTYAPAHVLLPPPTSSIIDAPLLEFPSQTSKASNTSSESPRSRLNTATQRFRNGAVVKDDEIEDEIAESQDRGDTTQAVRSTISDTLSSPVEWSQSESSHPRTARSAAQVLFPPPSIPVLASVDASNGPSATQSSKSQSSTLPPLTQILNKANSTESPSQSTRESQLSGTDDNLSTILVAPRNDHIQASKAATGSQQKAVANTSRKYDSAERSSGDSQSTTGSQPADSLNSPPNVAFSTIKPAISTAKNPSSSIQPAAIAASRILDEAKVIEAYKKRQRISDWTDDSRFSMADAEALRFNAQDIEQLAPEDADEVWQQWANEHPHHTKDQWKSYYERHRVLLLKYDESGDVMLTTPPVNKKRARESDVSSPLVRKDDISSTISRHTATPKRRKLADRQYSPAVPSSLPATPETQRVWPRQSSVNLSPPKSTQEQMTEQLQSELIRSTPEGRRLSLTSVEGLDQIATQNAQADDDDSDFEVAIVKVVDRTPSKAPSRPLARTFPAPSQGAPYISKPSSRPPPSTAPAAPQQRQTKTPAPSSSSRDIKAEVAQYFHEAAARKIPQEMAQKAFFATTGNLELARVAINGLKRTNSFTIRKGIWTEEDDETLMGLDAKKFEVLKRKHGDALMEQRRRYLTAMRK